MSTDNKNKLMSKRQIIKSIDKVLNTKDIGLIRKELTSIKESLMNCNVHLIDEAKLGDITVFTEKIGDCASNYTKTMHASLKLDSNESGYCVRKLGRGQNVSFSPEDFINKISTHEKYTKQKCSNDLKVKFFNILEIRDIDDNIISFEQGKKVN